MEFFVSLRTNDPLGAGFFYYFVNTCAYKLLFQYIYACHGLSTFTLLQVQFSLQSFNVHFPIATTLASFLLSGVYAAPSCTDTSDHFMNGSTRNNTLDAGMDLIAYFNDPAQNGVLSLPTQRAKSTCSISRQVGMIPSPGTNF